MQMNRCTSGTYNSISFFKKPSFFQNIYLVRENIVQALFFVIIESPYAPT